VEHAAAPGSIGELCSLGMNAWFADPAVLTDEGVLIAAMRAAAAAGQATVVGQASAVFPNGAVTAVLLLAESHLSVHTWPEHQLARFDLLTCGRLNAEMIMEQLRSALGASHVTIERSVHDLDLPVSLPAPGASPAPPRLS
jgi:S-adenosylmethionine decarboxylase